MRRDECSNYLDFWLTKGLDGMGLDAVGAYDRITVDINNSAISSVLNAHGVWSNPEGSFDRSMMTDWHYNSVQDYSLTGWVLPGYSAIQSAIDGAGLAGLEQKLSQGRDWMTSVLGTTIGPPGWEVPNISVPRRLLEIAMLTSVGQVFSRHDGQATIEFPAVVSTWADAEKEKLNQLVRTQNAYEALGPTGARTRLPTQDDAHLYAYRRMSKDGVVRALVVLNFTNSPQRATVDLSGTDIATHQTPIDLTTGAAAAPITSARYTVALPAYGYTILAVE